MKFDKIIMNPPYDDDLHLHILKMALNYLKEGGTCVNLSPIRWLIDPLVKYKRSFKSFKKFYDAIAPHIISLERVDSVYATSLFNCPINQDLGIYNCTKSNISVFDNRSLFYCPEATSILYKIYDSNKFVGITSKVTVEFDKNKVSNFIAFKKIVGGRGIDIDSCREIRNAIRYNTYFVNFKSISENKTLLEHHSGPNGNPDNWPIIPFNSEGEVANFYNSITTKFCSFLFKMTLVDVHVHPEFLPWMADVINPRTGLKGYESEWTDEYFYTYFNITEEEQKAIEETMQDYK